MSELLITVISQLGISVILGFAIRTWVISVNESLVELRNDIHRLDIQITKTGFENCVAKEDIEELKSSDRNLWGVITRLQIKDHQT